MVSVQFLKFIFMKDYMNGTTSNAHRQLMIYKERKSIQYWLLPLHNVYFVKYDVTVSFLAQVLNTVTYFVPQVLDTAS